jgi:hypothetical protein
LLQGLKPIFSVAFASGLKPRPPKEPFAMMESGRGKMSARRHLKQYLKLILFG